MTTTANGGTTDEASALEDELTHRLLASAAGLPRVCALKRCRRRKRCLARFGTGDIPCLAHHRGLLPARFQSALKRLGWAGKSSKPPKDKRDNKHFASALNHDTLCH